MIVLEIGWCGNLDQPTCIRTSEMFHQAVITFPTARIALSVGGYDADPRELDDIPEARDYVRQWASLAGLQDWRSPLVSHLEDQSVALLVVCGAFWAGHPYQVIRER